MTDQNREPVPPPAVARSVTVVLLLCLGFLGWSTLGALLRVYLADGNYSHGLLIPFIAGYMAWVKRDGFRRAGGGVLWPGAAVATAGVLLVLLGRWYDVALNPGALGHVFARATGLLLCAVGACWAAAGWRRLRAVAFPLAYLAFALPLPESVVTAATLPLRTLGAVFGASMLRAVGVVVLREGNVLHLAEGSVGVAEACSGIRSAWVLLAAAVALVHLCRLRPVRAVWLLALVPVLAVSGNLLRIFVSALWVARGHMAWVEGQPHQVLGVVTFAVSVLALFAVAGLRGHGRRTAPVEAVPAAPSGRAGAAPWIVAGLLALAGAMGLAVERHYATAYAAAPPPSATRDDLSGFPGDLGEFQRLSDLPLSGEALAVLEPTDWRASVYAGPAGERLHVTLLCWAPLSITPRNVQDFRYPLFPFPHLPDVCYPGAGWRRVSVFDGAETPSWLPGKTVHVRLFEKSDRRRVVVYWRDHVELGGRLFVPAVLAERWRALVASWRTPPIHTARGQYGVTIALDDGGDPVTSRAVGLRFAAAVAPHLERYMGSR